MGWAGMFGVAIGVTIAPLAERIPAHAATIETGAGALLIGGLALIGFALPSMF
jgi:hypothetical protein